MRDATVRQVAPAGDPDWLTEGTQQNHAPGGVGGRFELAGDRPAPRTQARNASPAAAIQDSRWMLRPATCRGSDGVEHNGPPAGGAQRGRIGHCQLHKPVCGFHVASAYIRFSGRRLAYEGSYGMLGQPQRHPHCWWWAWGSPSQTTTYRLCRRRAHIRRETRPVTLLSPDRSRPQVV